MKWFPVPFPVFEKQEVEGKRFYITPNGSYPSVTTKISDNPKPKPQFDAWVERVGKEKADIISYQATERGVALHRIVERFLKGESHLRGEMPINLLLFKKIKPILEQELKVIYGLESHVYSDLLKMAGTLDLFGVWKSDISVIDFKTSTKPKKKEWIEEYFIQATAYAMMIEEMKGLKVPQIVIIIAVEDGFPEVYENTPDTFRDQVMALHEINTM